MIAEDHRFDNLTQAWLEGDHYKWRAMRWNGVAEYFCSGNASPKEKFEKWAETVPWTLGNPLYHWTHLELARYFGIYKLLSPASSARIFNEASAMLKSGQFSTRSLIKKMNVELICTTDDPVDSLEYHQLLRSSFSVPVLPAFRPDNLFKVENPHVFKNYIERLEIISGISITGFNTLLDAIDKRHAYFHNNGCRLADHGIERFFFEPYTADDCNDIIGKLRNGVSVSAEDAEKFRFALLIEIARMNHKRGWTQQFHIGALRNNNSRMFRKSGADTGWDSISAPTDPRKMAKFLDQLDESDQLARTILYNLNPADNEVVITMAGNFNNGSIPAKVQYGAAWWFLDQKNGIERHLRDLASFGLLGRFAGMVTDSRSFLSYPRHEYFRRLLCNYLGEEIEKGFIPGDEDLIRPVIEGIVYKNAREYFRFNKQ